MGNEQPLKQITKGAGIILLGIFASKALGYVYRMIVARAGSFEYGLLSIGLTFLGIFSVIAVFGFDTSLVRYVAYYQKRKDIKKLKGVIISSLKFCGALSVIFCILLFFFAGFISQTFFHNRNLDVVLKIFALAIPFFVLRTLLLSITRGFQNVLYEIYSRDISENVARVIFTIFLIYFGMSTFGISLVYFFALAFSFFLAAHFCKKQISYLFKNSIKPVFLTKEWLGYSWPLTASAVLMLIMMWTDNLMLGYFRTISEVGIYNTVMPTAQLMRVFTSALLTLFLPVLTALMVQKQYKTIKAVYRTINKWVFIATLPLLGLFILFPKQILTILFGAEYGQGGFTLVIISIGYFIYCFTMISSQLIMLIEKTRVIFYNLLASAILNVFLNYLLIPHYGIEGAALATSISFILVSLLFFIQGFIYLQVVPLYRCYIKVLFSSAVSFTIVFILKNYLYIGTSVPKLILLSIVFCCVYAGMVLLTRVLEKEDISIIKSVRNKFGLKINVVDHWLDNMTKE